MLSGILIQNTKFHAGMSSPVASLINGCLEQIGAGSEFYSFFDEKKRIGLCKAIYESYYKDINADVVFDTNRMWTSKMHQLVEMYDDVKVICMVRDISWIMDSFEKIFRKNPFDYSKMFNPANRMTVYSRSESLLNGIVGLPLTALKEAFYGEYSDKLLLVDYDLLAQFPEKTMKLIYDFIGEPYFNHDFDNVNFSHDEFDYSLGVKGLHDVKKKIEYVQRRSILPPDLFQKYSELAFWKDTSGSAANVITVKNK